MTTHNVVYPRSCHGTALCCLCLTPTPALLLLLLLSLWLVHYSVWWQAVPYFLSGASEVFTNIGCMELFYTNVSISLTRTSHETAAFSTAATFPKGLRLKYLLSVPTTHAAAATVGLKELLLLSLLKTFPRPWVKSMAPDSGRSFLFTQGLGIFKSSDSSNSR